MKTLRLLFAAMVLLSVKASAQSGQVTIIDYDPNVVVTGMRGAPADRAAIAAAVQHYMETHVSGFQQSGLPNFIITGRNDKFLLGIGGFASFRTAYDFDGIVQNEDFVTYNIPVPGTPATRQKFNMDASTSRIFFKAIANTKALGRVTTYIETDFRGGNYNLRLRQAYVSFKGWLFGRAVTTFCDLNASPTTIDFEGPNAYNFGFNQMVRYTRSFGKHWSIGAAIEMPDASITYAPGLTAIPQRLPDLPVYAQYSWGKNGASHLRASAVFRDLYYYNELESDNRSAFGWGAQLTTQIKVARPVTLFGQAVYGQGITPYIQDISGAGLDLVPDPNDPGKLQTLPMLGWFAAAQYNFTPNLFVSGGYSMVRINSRNDFYVPDVYRNASYVFGNIFYNITPNCQIALEYLYGKRKDMNLESNHANRIQAMIQYNF